jgi:hypothetical protein
MDSRLTHLEIFAKKFQPKSHKVMIWWQSYIENPNTMKINKATHQNMLIKNTERNSKLSSSQVLLQLCYFELRFLQITSENTLKYGRWDPLGMSLG